MKSKDEGIGRLSAEDIEAIRGEQPQQENIVDAINRMVAESDQRIDAAEKEAQKAIVLGRAAVIASTLANVSTAEFAAKVAFDVLAALDAEYEKRYGS